MKTVKEIAKLVNGELAGNGATPIRGISGIKEAKEGDISFILDPKYEDLIDTSKASALIAPKNLKKSHSKTLIKVDNPSIIFSRLIETFMPGRIPHPKGIDKTAVISKNASIGKNVSVGAYSVISAGASIGDNTVLYPFCYIGDESRLGADCLIYPNVTIREKVTIGNRVIIHPGSVIGSDGFGYNTNPQDGTQIKIPQLGTVIIEDDVELGACVTIDRARFDKTVIGRGTKVDNLVQIAHNAIIGPNCLIAAQAGISGSSELGKNVILGGQVGIADHLKIGDFVMAGAQSGITKSFPANTTLFGYPAKPIKKARDIIASIGLLPKLFERVKALEDKIKELTKR